jgi:hypothetical protein
MIKFKFITFYPLQFLRYITNDLTYMLKPLIVGICLKKTLKRLGTHYDVSSNPVMGIPTQAWLVLVILGFIDVMVELGQTIGQLGLRECMVFHCLSQ